MCWSNLPVSWRVYDLCRYQCCDMYFNQGYQVVRFNFSLPSLHASRLAHSFLLHSFSATGFNLSLNGTCSATCADGTYAVDGVCIKCVDPFALRCNATVSTLWWVTLSLLTSLSLPPLSRFVLVFPRDGQVNRGQWQWDNETMTFRSLNWWALIPFFRSTTGYDLSLNGTCGSTCSGATYPLNGICEKCIDVNAATCTPTLATAWFVVFSFSFIPPDLDFIFQLCRERAGNWSNNVDSNTGFNLQLNGTCATLCAGATYPLAGVCTKCADVNALTCDSLKALSWYAYYSYSLFRSLIDE